MSVIASIRPDSWNFPLFLHVLGAMVLVGAAAIGSAGGTEGSVGGFSGRSILGTACSSGCPGTVRASVSEPLQGFD